jgi:hypothetical protein
MPTYIVQTKVRRTWRERLLSRPWKPWQATKIVAEQIDGPYPWDLTADDLVKMRRNVSREAFSMIFDSWKRAAYKKPTPERAAKILDLRQQKQDAGRSAMVSAIREKQPPRWAPCKPSSDDLASRMLAHHVHHSAMMQATTTWPDPPASTECAPTTDTACCDTSSSTDSGSSCGE